MLSFCTPDLGESLKCYKTATKILQDKVEALMSENEKVKKANKRLVMQRRVALAVAMEAATKAGARAATRAAAQEALAGETRAAAARRRW